MKVFLSGKKIVTPSYPHGIEEAIIFVNEKSALFNTIVLITKKRIEIFHKGTIIKVEI